MQKNRDINNYTDSYISHDFEDIQVKYRKKEILKHFNNFKPKKILEIGCGKSPFFTEGISYEKYVVVEPSKLFAQNAISLKDNENIHVINDFVENRTEELKKENFDFILLSSLLHEVQNPEVFMDKIKELASSKTIIHINVPNSLSFHRVLAFEAGLIGSLKELSESNIKLQQNSVFDLQSICSLVDSSGFTVIDKGSYFIKPFTHKQMSELLNKNIINKQILDGLYNMSKYLPELGSEIFVNLKVK